MPWTLPRLKRSRKAHHQRAVRRRQQAHKAQALAKRLDALAEKQHAIVQRRTEQIRAARRAKHGPEAALNEARRYIGKTESPPGSNKAPWGLTDWIRHFLGISYGVAWCGIGVGHCLQAAGVRVTGRVASVYNNYVDAGNGVNGWLKRVGITEAQPGDVLGLFGLSTHTELVEKRVPGGYQTIGFNTSSGNSGSQSNGGGCFRRLRPYSDVVYVARPDYS